MFSYLPVADLVQLEVMQVYSDKSQSTGGKIWFRNKLHW